MNCKSDSVKELIERNSQAATQINDLQATIDKLDSQYRVSFEKKVSEYYSMIQISDAKTIDENRQIKTEYASEFSLDKILGIVTSVLTIVSKSVPAGSFALSQDTIKAFGDLVNSVAEASKSSSSVAASLTFSANRITPGVIALVSASTQNIKDKNLFKSEAVTTTAIYYRVVASIQDIQNYTAFGAAQADLQTILAFKSLQLALVDDVKSNHITMEDWFKKDQLYNQAIEVIKARLRDNKSQYPVDYKMARQAFFGSLGNHDILLSAIKDLSTRGTQFTQLVELSKERLAHSYF